MKIGILTFHCAHNYGAVLQCYALQEHLKNKGYIVEIINYRPQYLLNPYKVFQKGYLLSKNPIMVLRKCISYFFTFYIRYKRHQNFNAFIGKYLKEGKIVNKDNIPDCYDVYIMGSDQIWNPNITKGFDNIYFGYLPFIKNNHKFISYAASMEAKELTFKSKEYLKISFRNFDALSVREINLVNLFQPLTDNIVQKVLDPTLLVDKQIWNALLKPVTLKKKYVFVYQVRVNKQVLKIADYIAKQINGEVVVFEAWIKLVYGFWKFQDASPTDFISYIKDAACVVTTSFHGTAFSIIFNKPFYTVKLGDNKDSRSESLLTSLDLHDRMINVNDLPIYSTVDYSNANIKLREQQEDSDLFLINSIH